MKASLLVVTPKNSFGELIRQSLTETGSFQIHMAKGKADAILKADQEACTIALLDMELGERALLEIGRSLRSMNPDLDLVILADDELPPSMDAIRPWVLLRKPFYLPDFIQLIKAVPIIPDKAIDEFNEEQIMAYRKEKSQSVGAMEDEPTPGILWLNDVSKAAQHLTRLTLESSAQAALITREKELWAYAGQLSQNAANELASTVSRHWDGQKGNDLLRFVRLEATKAEHMLYATSMTDDVILALVFDAETPFSTIRSQASSLAKSLAVAKTGPVPVVPVSPTPVEAAPEPTPESKQEQVEAEIEADLVDLEETDDDVEVPSIAEILNEIPPPVPPARGEVDVAAADPYLDPSAAATRPSTPISHRRPSTESSPAIRLNNGVVVDDEPATKNSFLQNITDGLAATLPSKSQRRRPATPVRQPAPGEFDETRPHTVTSATSKMVPESASASLSAINFACLLVPRFTAHYMTGDLADRMSEWMPNICVAFGWRLEFLAVRPDYLQWVINVMPKTSPGYLMRIIRQQTSEKIFDDFPRLKRENPSGDFWAPGYLIMGGKEPHPQQLVKDFIKQTRQRQGISHL